MSRQIEKDRLLELRSKVAKREGQSTYLVFNDNELEVILNERPKTLEELSKIKGFPKDGKRVKAYGIELVSIFDGRGDTLSAISRLANSNIFN